MATTSLLTEYQMSSVSPDFDAIYERLQTILQTANETPSSGAWSELLAVSTGAFLLRAMATVTADNAFALERAQHEVHLDTARRPSSILAMTRSMGVHIQRRQPASMSIFLSRSANLTSALTIPSYTVFNAGGKSFFTRDPITFAAGVEGLTFTVYEGTFTTETYTSSGAAFQRYLLGRKDFTLSDYDLYCTVGTSTVKWAKTTTGLWEYGSTDKVFYENTTPDGRVMVWFGDGIYGALPAAGDTIVFSYVLVTNTDLDLASIPVDSAVTVSGYSDLIGITKTVPSGMTDVRNVEFYRAMAPHMNDATPITSTRANYKAACLEYQGVIDAQVRGQAEINPSDLRWMNGIAVTLLTQSTWGDADFTIFTNYLHNRGISTLHVFNWPARVVYVDVTCTLRCVNRANLTTVKNQAETLITDLFKAQYGSLGRYYAVTDIAYVLKKGITDPYGDLVTAVVMTLPAVDIELQRDQYAVLRTVSVTAIYDPATQFKTVQGVTVPLTT